MAGREARINQTLLESVVKQTNKTDDKTLGVMPIERAIELAIDQHIASDLMTWKRELADVETQIAETASDDAITMTEGRATEAAQHSTRLRYAVEGKATEEAKNLAMQKYVVDGKLPQLSAVEWREEVRLATEAAEVARAALDSIREQRGRLDQRAAALRKRINAADGGAILEEGKSIAQEIATLDDDLRKLSAARIGLEQQAAAVYLARDAALQRAGTAAVDRAMAGETAELASDAAVNAATSDLAVARAALHALHMRQVALADRRESLLEEHRALCEKYRIAVATQAMVRMRAMVAIAGDIFPLAAAACLMSRQKMPTLAMLALPDELALARIVGELPPVGAAPAIDPPAVGAEEVAQVEAAA